jgi:hypothetical protein
MNLICNECKNPINLGVIDPLVIDDVIECEICGTSLIVLETNPTIILDVFDEGK